MFPLVSIVIPCWNAHDHVAGAIQSALAQSYGNIEVIVIDDGSTDKSLDVIRSFGDQICWRSGSNRGACAARNQGIGLARGELVQFVDADDRLCPQKLERMVPFAVKHGQGCLVVCDWERIELDTENPIRKSLKLPTDDEVIWCSYHGIQTASPVHWKEVLERTGGFDESLPCAQERDLHLRLACHGLRFIHIPEVLIRVHRLPGSLSSDSLRVYKQHLGVVDRAHRLLEDLGRQTEARSAALAGLLARDARVLLRAGLAKEARLYFEKARKLHAEGGFEHAYRPLQKLAAKCIGASLFERLVGLKRLMSRRLTHAGD